MSIDKTIIHEAVHRFLRYSDMAARCQERGLPYTGPRLRRLTHEGKGPKFVYCGRYPLFREDWFAEWLAEQLSPVTTKTRRRSKQEPRAA